MSDTFYGPRGFAFPSAIADMPDALVRADHDADAVGFTSNGIGFVVEATDASGPVMYSVCVLRNFKLWDNHAAREGWDLIERVQNLDTVHEWSDLGAVSPEYIVKWLRAFLDSATGSP